MARFAIIDAGRVINHAEASKEFAASQGWVPALDSRIGDLWDGEKFTTPAVDLTAMKELKKSEINEARLAANFSTFPYSGKVFACDQLSRSDIDGTNGFVSLYGTLPPAWPGGWKAVDNTYISITTVQDWKDFYSSMFAQGNANFIHAQALKDKLQLATTAKEIQEITWGMEL